MKIKRSELENIIENYLRDDIIQEGRFGSIEGGVNFEFCDLSRIPVIFTDFLEAVKNKNVIKLEERLQEEIGKSSNQDEINKISNTIKQLNNDPGFLLAIVKHPLFSKATTAFGYGLSFLLAIDKTECEYRIAMIENFTYNILLPLFGVSSDRVRGEIEKTRVSSAQSEANLENPITDSTRIAGLTALTTAMADKGITQKVRNERDAIPEKYHKKLTQFDFDLLELMSPNAYKEFLKDPRKKLPNSLVDELRNCYDVLEDRGHKDFEHWNHAFLLATPGVADDQKLKRVLKKIQWESYFEDANDLNKEIRARFNKIISKLPVEGVQIFTRI